MRRVTFAGAVLLAAAAWLGGCGHASPPLLQPSPPASRLPDDGFVKVPGGRVAFRVLGGGGSGIPVLVIHGGPGGSSCGYVDTLGALAADRPVVLYDQLGSGNSDRMTDLARDAVLTRFVAEVAAVRERLGLAEVHLVGHSWGATVALEYLLTAAPAGVRSVTLAGPLVSTPLWLEDTRALVRTLPAETQAAIRAAIDGGDFDSPAFKAAEQVFSRHFEVRLPGTRESLAQRLPACAATPRRFDPELYRTMWGPAEFVSTGTLRDHDRVGRLGELRLPTLFLVGEYDMARPETMARLQRLVPGSVLTVIPGASHGAPLERTSEFNAALADFFASVERRGAR